MKFLKEDNTNYPNLQQTWGLFGIFLLITLGLMLAYIIISQLIPKHLTEQFIEEQFTDWEKLFIYIISISGTVLYAKKASHSDSFDYGIVVNKSPVLLFVMLAVVVPAMIVVVDFIVELIPMSEAIEKQFAELVSISFPSFLTVAIAAPILEEILCRGIILKGLLKNMTPYKAILWSSFFFAALHLNPWQGVAAFIIGFISGWIFWKTRSIIPCIFIHFLNNGISFLVMFIVGEENSTVSLSELFADGYAVTLLLSLLTSVAGLYLIYRELRFYNKEK